MRRRGAKELASRANNVPTISQGVAREDDDVGARREYRRAWLARVKRMRSRGGHCHAGRPSGCPCCPPGQSPARRGRLVSARRSDVARVQVCSRAGYWPRDFKGVQDGSGEFNNQSAVLGGFFWVRGNLGSPERKRASAASPILVWVRLERGI